MKNTVTTLLKMKEEGEKISMLTAYDFTTAKLVERAGINTILVGDSLGNTMQGYENTLPVTMEEMIVYARSVTRAAKEAFVIVDMPFMSYQISPAQALENAGRLIKETGAHAVKLEGGGAVAPQIKAIVDAGIPVCAHIGMTPQSVNVFGGFKVQGKGLENAKRILEDAKAVEEAGAFMCVLECVPPRLSGLVTQKSNMITIGIGAGGECDGQVLVIQDMLGMNDGFVPKFVKPFANLAEAMTGAFKEYDSEVKTGSFPAPEHTYAKSDLTEEELNELKDRG